MFNNLFPVVPPTETRRPPERRTSSQLVTALLAAGASRTAPRLAVVETAAGMWERSFAAAICKALPASLLGYIGRQLLLAGEAVLYRTPAGWVPVSSFEVRGRHIPVYRLSYSVPDGSVNVPQASSKSVLHPRLGIDPSRPWRGVSPLAGAGLTVALLGRLEASLDAEHRLPVGVVLPVHRPDVEEDDTDTTLEQSLASLRGGIVTVEQASSGSPIQHQRSDNSPRRIGPDPSTETVTALQQVERSVAAAAGIPVDMLAAGSAAPAMREARRLFLHGTIAPAGRVLSAELGRVGEPPDLDWSELRVDDLQGKARAFKLLTESGFSAADARDAVGL